MIHAFLLILAAAYFWVMASGQVGITDCAVSSGHPSNGDCNLLLFALYVLLVTFQLPSCFNLRLPDLV